MKANELDGKDLMVGDFVYGCIETDVVGEATYKILCKVTDINHYGDVRCEALKPFPDELGWQDGDDFSWIESIPLTAEILERNGFDNVIWQGEASWSYHENEVYVCISGRSGGIKHFGYNGWDSKIAIFSVHELQHALRLCGIDKNIVL